MQGERSGNKIADNKIHQAAEEHNQKAKEMICAMRWKAEEWKKKNHHKNIENAVSARAIRVSTLYVLWVAQF